LLQEASTDTNSLIIGYLQAGTLWLIWCRPHWCMVSEAVSGIMTQTSQHRYFVTGSSG
jgi:hypothetical protein